MSLFLALVCTLFQKGFSFFEFIVDTGRLVLFLKTLFFTGVLLCTFGASASHFSYVNLNAPKGGMLSLATGNRSFDSFLPFDKKTNAAEGSSTLLFATLLKTPLSNPSQSVPYLANKVEISPSEKTILFHLNSTARFSDGSPIHAEDVAFSSRLLQQENFSWGFFFENLKSIQVLSQKKIMFSFKQLSKETLPTLGRLPIFSEKHYLKAQNKTHYIPLSSGPYVVDRQGKNFVHYRRQRGWWGENLPSNKGQYNFDTIAFTYYANPEIAFEDFRKRNLNWWREVRFSSWLQKYKDLIERKSIHTIETDKPFPHGLFALFINTRHWPYNQKKVRQALSLMLNFPKMNSLFFYGGYVRINSIFTDSNYASVQPGKKFAYEPAALSERKRREKALALLKEAGFFLNHEKALVDDRGRRVVMRLVLSSARQEKIFQEYVRALEKIGIKVYLWGQGMLGYTQKCTSFDFDMAVSYAPQSNAFEENLFSLWSSDAAVRKGSYNLSGVIDPYVDFLLHKIKNQKTMRRQKIYAMKLDRYILENAYVIPLWIPEKVYTAFSPQLDFPQNLSNGKSLDRCPEGYNAKLCKRFRNGARSYSYLTWWKKQ